MLAMPPIGNLFSRRSFIRLLAKLSLAGSTCLGLLVLLRYLGYRSPSSPPVVNDLGPASSFPPGSRIWVMSVHALVIHDDQGYGALSLICPHLGCEVHPTPEGFSCPCHGSRFLPDGSLRTGPATQSLRKLDIAVNADGHLILDGE
jgi:cytochrome b6-f complex iron-sulfur subunit